MSANSGVVPDAWEDSWENQADKLDSKSTPPSEKKVSSKVTKAQRRAEQAEFNRQLWAEAESTETFHFVEARADVPLKHDFKPAVTLLSRKPQLVTRQSSSSSSSSSRAINAAAAGLGRLGLDDDDDSDDDAKPPQPTPEERHAIALKNREEKQRKYEEVRERLFGSPSATASGTSSPGNTTPPRQISTGEGRGRGKGRGGGRDHPKRDSSSTSSKSSRHLYDPSTSAKSNAPFLQRGGRPQVERSGSDTQAPQQPVRSPRGPDASGRGGFNFNRGARTG
ncbi:SUZ domain [Penicillium digitatum]|uniref:SUZ domain-containing protein n=3 Tax=Penicillium digitatum TaxID=36651 RepID=K9FDH0_PEND2|nr:hypothetical protein PDIP_42940 [Penicillium digitatum Pd1]EKV07385.1 hypothetical protein PDIG_72460 [Penicillium digitatum PHI26]EKV14598.1 hypothetical protein PDIP_42940 [Penicillium digitatum Pd1]KAG0159934.1 hypothetical protein PDIDSM_7461 [Penicillium digitatum]QQK45956.1 SUZ domain [Penicillium digitatum]